jgi:hypothetical protein
MENQTEIWKDIPGYEGLYQVSNLGNVKSCSRIRKGGRYNCVRTYKEKQLKNIKNPYGYIYVQLYGENHTKKYFTHRLVALAFVLNPEKKPSVNHINGIKHDNRVENLEWVTHSENTIHAFKTNLIKIKHGEDSNNSKLTEKQVLEIREYKGIISQSKLGKIYGVGQDTICRIMTRRNWKHI